MDSVLGTPHSPLVLSFPVYQLWSSKKETTQLHCSFKESEFTQKVSGSCFKKQK